ncbi:MAG: selenium-binding protein [Methylibium sp. NZG]|nr:MAG: selenium-binding protein [Methylibium sp. NZG]
MFIRHSRLGALLLATAAASAVPLAAMADETCNSPYMANLIKGQEDFVHVWTLGVKGWGDSNDKLVTIDVNPASKQYGKVVHTLSVPGRGEAHHMGFTDDRRFLWAGRLDDNKIYVIDLKNPAKPRLTRTIDNIATKTGFVGPHTFYAIPGRMLVQALSNTKDHGGRTGLVTFDNGGRIIASHPMPVGEVGGVKADGYGYDIGINPGKNVMLTSSFTGWNNYMMDLGKLIKDAEAMKNFGNTMAIWDYKAMQPKKVFSVPGAPLEIRWSLNAGDNWAVTATALTSKIWLVKQDAAGEWQAKDVATIGDPSKIPLPVDISITADGKGLWVNTFMDGKTRYFDLSNPEAPKQTYEKVTGKQVNMVSQSWDGKRIYVTSSLLANWDKQGDDNEQVLRLFAWDGKELTQKLEVDFKALKLGRAHHMKFSARPQGKSMADAYPATREQVALQRP